MKAGRIVVRCDLEEERRANRRFLRIETRGDAAGFAAAATRLGCECDVLAGGRMKMVLPAEVGVRDLYRAAAESGTEIRRLDYKRDSLQDIFMRAMEDPRGGP